MSAATHIVSGDVLDDTYQLDFKNVRLQVRRSRQRAEFRIVHDPKNVGVIRFGSGVSGALWVNDECIGEYEQVGNEYFVTPVVNGRRQGEPVKVHPVEFLLNSLTKFA